VDLTKVFREIEGEGMEKKKGVEKNGDLPLYTRFPGLSH